MFTCYLVTAGCKVLSQAVFGNQQAVIASLPAVFGIFHADYEALLAGFVSLQAELISMLINNDPCTAC